MSNTSAFKGKKIAVMVASGFNEEQFLIIQKTILAAEGSYTIISRDIGTTNGWASEKWGLSYPVDQPVSETLAIDCLLYTSPSPRDNSGSRMPSSA